MLLGWLLAPQLFAKSITTLGEETVRFLQDAGERNRHDALIKSRQFQSALDTSIYDNDRLTAAFGLGAYFLGNKEAAVAMQYLSVAEKLAGPHHPLAPIISMHRALAAHELGAYEASIATAMQLNSKVKELGTQINTLRVRLILDNMQQLGRHADVLKYYKNLNRRQVAWQSGTAMEIDALVTRSHLALGADWEETYSALERLASPYPTTNNSRWAFDQLAIYSAEAAPSRPKYTYSTTLLRSLARNITLDKNLRTWLAAKLHEPLLTLTGVRRLSATEKIDFFNNTRMYPEASVLAADTLANDKSALADRSRILLQAARAAAEINNDAQTIAYYQDYVNEYSPTFIPPKVREMMAFAFNRMGDFKQAATYFRETAVRGGPDYMRWHHFWNTYRAGDWAEALALLDRGRYLIPQDPNEPNALLYWRAKVLEKLDHDSAAKQDYLALLKRDSNSFYSAFIHDLHPDLKYEIPVRQPVLTASLGTTMNFDHGLSFEAKTNMPREEYPLLYNETVEPLCEKLSLNKFLVLSIMRSESLYNALATSPVGAKGLLQLMPYTALRIASMINHKDFIVTDLESPEVNIVYGTFYLKYLLTLFENPMVAVAAYNAGPIAVNNWLTRCKDCSIDEFVESIPYRETRRYVKEVFRHFAEYSRKYNGDGELPISWKIPAALQDTSELF